MNENKRIKDLSIEQIDYDGEMFLPVEKDGLDETRKQKVKNLAPKPSKLIEDGDMIESLSEIDKNTQSLIIDDGLGGLKGTLLKFINPDIRSYPSNSTISDLDAFLRQHITAGITEYTTFSNIKRNIVNSTTNTNRINTLINSAVTSNFILGLIVDMTSVWGVAMKPDTASVTKGWLWLSKIGRQVTGLFKPGQDTEATWCLINGDTFLPGAFRPIEHVTFYNHEKAVSTTLIFNTTGQVQIHHPETSSLYGAIGVSYIARKV